MEHGLTRGADALISILLLWILSPESFSKIALAQAVVAPILLFFVSPETVLYRDFAIWRELGPSEQASRLHGLRVFAWGKVQLAFLISIGIAIAGDHSWIRFWSMIWAFSLALAPQISGPDREFLRLNLRLQELSAISLIQKLSLLVGTVFCSFAFRGRIEPLALAGLFSCLVTAWIARNKVRNGLLKAGASPDSVRGKSGPSVTQTLSESLVGFSLWQHLNGVVVGWVQTMDLFFLGILRFPARELGLYAAVLKIANFSIAAPLALANTFSLWVSQSVSGRNLTTERAKLLWVTFMLTLGVAVQGILLYVLSPWLFRLLSHDRWGSTEISLMVSWLKWILAGASVFAAAWPLASWLIVRTNIRRLFWQLYCPWGILSVLVYFAAASKGQLLEVAKANVIVSGIYIFLLFVRFRGSVVGNLEGSSE